MFGFFFATKSDLCQGPIRSPSYQQQIMILPELQPAANSRKAGSCCAAARAQIVHSKRARATVDVDAQLLRTETRYHIFCRVGINVHANVLEPEIIHGAWR